jgi:peptidoglycan/LPS O-acetylase OafA/YrhL
MTVDRPVSAVAFDLRLRLTNDYSGGRLVPVGLKSERKPYLDGLRGFAALAVFTGHLMLVLVPELIQLNSDQGWAVVITAIGKSPLAVLWAGNSAVCVFFVLSGYVMAVFAQRTTLSLPAQILRRYLRLAIPILITSSFAYLLMRAGLMRNLVDPDLTGGWLSHWYDFGYSGQAMVYESLIGTFVTGSNAYTSNIWTMYAELYGSAYVMLFFAVGRGRLERTALWVWYIAWDWKGYMPLFAVGALLCDYEAELRRIPTWFAVALFVAGAYMCSLPFLALELLPWHRLLPAIFPFDQTRYWHSVGAILIVAAVLRAAPLQAMFASRLGRFLGRISFTLYLVHIPLLSSFTAAIVLAMRGTGRVPTLVVAGSATVILVIGLSWLVADLVDGAGVRLSRMAGRAWMRIFSDRDIKPVPASADA